MKKIILLFLAILSVLTLVSCKKEKEDINTPKEFKTGDIVTSNGVIYQYIDVCKDIETLEGEEAKEYIFEEEENYKAYYNLGCIFLEKKAYELAEKNLLLFN